MWRQNICCFGFRYDVLNFKSGVEGLTKIELVDDK